MHKQDLIMENEEYPQFINSEKFKSDLRKKVLPFQTSERSKKEISKLLSMTDREIQQGYVNYLLTYPVPYSICPEGKEKLLYNLEVYYHKKLPQTENKTWKAIEKYRKEIDLLLLNRKIVTSIRKRIIPFPNPLILKILFSKKGMIPIYEKNYKLFWNLYRDYFYTILQSERMNRLNKENQILKSETIQKILMEVAIELPIIQKTQDKKEGINIPGLKWNDLTIIFLSDEEVKINIVGKREIKIDFQRMGFGTIKKKPKRIWKTLKIFADYEGELPSKISNKKDSEKFRRQLTDIRKRLSDFFNIDEDPFYNAKISNSYKTKFKIMSKTAEKYDLEDRKNDNSGFDIFKSELEDKERQSPGIAKFGKYYDKDIDESCNE